MLHSNRCTTVHRSCDDIVPAIVSTHGQVFAMTTFEVVDVYFFPVASHRIVTYITWLHKRLPGSLGNVSIHDPGNC